MKRLDYLHRMLFIRADAMVRMPKNTYRVLPGARISGEVVCRIRDDGTRIVLVHGFSGPGSSLSAVKEPEMMVLPSATLINQSGQYVAWDGDDYVVQESLEDITSDEGLMLIGRIPEPKLDQAEIDRRKRLLSDYIAHTGASHKSIYEGKNSGIHKPQFFEWKHGKLPPTSATAKNFERFLREKKPPIHR